MDCDVPAFRRASRAAGVDSVVKHDSSSYACAQRGVKDATITGPSAPDGFGKRSGVSVVVHRAGIPKTRWTSAASGKFCQQGRFGGLMTTPVRGSRGPGEQIP